VIRQCLPAGPRADRDSKTRTRVALNSRINILLALLAVAALVVLYILRNSRRLQSP
jgi:hypothetical protein